jgi:glucose/arabinose dehydrogenase
VTVGRIGAWAAATAAGLLAALAACGGAAPSAIDAGEAPADAGEAPPDALPDARTPEPCEPVAGEPPLALAALDLPTLSRPIVVSSPPDDPRLFVLEQHDARILIIEGGALREEPFLDLSGAVARGFEQGLIGLAFHPEYAVNGRLFVSYTAALTGDSYIVEYRVSGDPNRVDPGSRQVVLIVQQPFRLHNGGHMAFGPDGYLYIGFGDGVDYGGLHLQNAQNLTNLLGTLVRIDVDEASPGAAYGIPPDNPFVEADDYRRPEIWSYGLRNPWGFSFDPATGDLYLPDVGQSAREELNIEPFGAPGGRNYGWHWFEGTRCNDDSEGCDEEGLTPPVYEFGHDEGCAIIGGAVYRGCRMPGHHGKYLLIDWCNRLARTLEWNGAEVENVIDWPALRPEAPGSNVGSIAVDGRGELYLADRNGGVIYQVVPGTD